MEPKINQNQNGPGMALKGKGTALHHATHSGHPELVDILLKAGANPTARDSQNELPGESFDREVHL